MGCEFKFIRQYGDKKLLFRGSNKYTYIIHGIAVNNIGLFINFYVTENYCVMPTAEKSEK